MNQYNLILLTKKINIGKVIVSDNKTTIDIKLENEYVFEYKPVLIKVIENIQKKGKFKVNFDQDKLIVTDVDTLFWQALIQTLVYHSGVVIHPIN